MAHVNHAYAESNDDLNRRSLNSLSPTFFIQPKTTGLVSLFIQVVLIIVSATTSLFFFYHVGGYEYTHWNENSTILEPINHNANRGGMTLAQPINGSDSLVSTQERNLDFALSNYPYLYDNDSFDVEVYNNDSFDVEAVSIFLDSGNGPFIENASFGIEQVPLTTVIIGDVEFDWLEVIRISTLVYILICGLWCFSGVLFICTIRCEILDSVILNTTVLILVVLFQVAHAGLVTSLIFFQREMSWRTLSITIGSIIIIFCCAFLGFVCISLNCGWVKYIDYMHGKKKCTICSIFSLCGKSDGRRANPSTRNGTATQNGQYENDVPLDRFDAF